ncbi:MAG: hypothetical protein JW883_16210 [Deltaproteobacteria bacterium]|nr:hypothetical protein [Deltaproteobacteria bacterium]
MGRQPQKPGNKGSLKWIQKAVNDRPDLLDLAIKKALILPASANIEWVSPLKNDEYAEYRDGAFLKRLGVELKRRPLKDFWPAQGPQWDALGRIDGKAYFLVEAKAHVAEIISSSQAKSPASISLIGKSLDDTRAFLKLSPHVDLTKGFYQYANRLAHLYLLRELNEIPAYLVFVYFVNDPTHIPTIRDEWNGALKLMHAILGTHRHKFSRYVIDIFINIDKLKN